MKLPLSSEFTPRRSYWWSRTMFGAFVIALSCGAVPIGIKQSSIPTDGTTVQHLVVGFNSAGDCEGLMKHFEPLVERGSIKIDGHLFEFEAKDTAVFADRMFLWSKSIDRRFGVFVFDAEGKIEYAIGPVRCPEEVLDHLGQIVKGVTLPSLADSMSQDPLELDRAWRYRNQLSHKSDEECLAFEERIRSADPQLVSTPGIGLRFWALAETWLEAQTGLAKEEIRFRPMVQFLEDNPAPEVSFLGYKLLAVLAGRVERPELVREFYGKALDNCPEWRRRSLRVEARDAGVQLPLHGARTPVKSESSGS